MSDFSRYKQLETGRDISLIEINSQTLMVIATDSAGGIGPKEEDQLKVPGKIVGSFTTRVALMEVMAVGAVPVNIINTLSVEYDPTGIEIIEGVRAEVEAVGYNSDMIINGSTEENIPTSQTGVGVTVIGFLDQKRMRLSSSREGDIIIAVGLPMVGPEVLENENLIADPGTLLKLVDLNFIHEILPVGSKGIRYESRLLARMAGLQLKLENNVVDLDKSAGPATVLLAALKEDDILKVKDIIEKPVNVIGRME